jgi:hypothetical protein
MTNRVGLDLSTVVANSLKKLLDFSQKTNMEHRRRELNVTEMSRALFWTLFASLAVVLTVNGTQTRVIDTLGPRPLALVIQCLGVFDVDHTHALDLFGGKETELNFLDGAQRRLRVREKHVRHDGEVVVTKK